MNTIMKCVNFLKGYRKLKVQAIVGNHAIVTNQRGQFIGIVSASLAKNTTEFWGKQASSTQKVAVLTHGSYKSRMKVYKPVVKCSDSNDEKKWWGYDQDKNLVIIECYNITVEPYRTIIPGELECFKEIPWVNVIIDDDKLL
jgi:hypothetical protein